MITSENHTFHSLFLFTLLLVSSLTAAVLQNDCATWTFSETGMPVSILLNGQPSPLQLAQPPRQSPWAFTIASQNGSYQETLTAADTHRPPKISVRHQTMTMVWTGIKGKSIRSSFRLTLTVELRPDGSTAWNALLEGKTEGEILQLTAPVLSGLNASAASALLLPEQGGQLIVDPASQQARSLTYPYPASMQFMGFLSSCREDGSSVQELANGLRPSLGLLIYAEDRQARLKSLNMSQTQPGQLTLSISYHPPHPLASFRKSYFFSKMVCGTSYPTVVVPFYGDSFTATRLYRQWSQTAFSSQSHVSLLNDIPFWTQTHFDPEHALSEWDVIRQKLAVPAVALYHSYTLAKHGVYAPDLFPADPYLLNGFRGAKRLSVSPAPCIQSSVWDPSSQTLIRQRMMALQISPLSQPLPSMEPAASLQSPTIITNNMLKLTQDHRAPAVFFEDFFQPLIRQTVEDSDCTVTEQLCKILDDCREASPNTGFIVNGLSEILLGKADAAWSCPVPSHDNSIPFPLWDSVYHGQLPVAGSAADLASLSTHDSSQAVAVAAVQGNRPSAEGLLSDAVSEENLSLPRNLSRLFHGIPWLNEPSWQRVSLAVTHGSKPTAASELSFVPSSADTSSLHAASYTQNSRRLVLLVNSSDQTLTGTLCGIEPSSQVQSLWPTCETLAPSSALPLSIPPRNATVIELASSDTTLEAPSIRKPLPPVVRVLHSTEEQTFEFHDADHPDELWCCDDGVTVRNGAGKFGLLDMNDTLKKLSYRKGGLELSLSSEQTDGFPLPRARETQPFAILFKLPHTLKNPPLTYIQLANEHCILLNGILMNNGQSRFHTPNPGVFAARLQPDKNAPEGVFKFFKTEEELNSAIADSSLYRSTALAYASLDEASLTAALTQLPSSELADAWRTMRADPTAANLAMLSRIAREWFESARLKPWLFAPGTPCEQLLRQIRALVGCAGTYPTALYFPFLSLNNDWLTPGIDKKVAVCFYEGNHPNLALQQLQKTTLSVLGFPDATAVRTQLVTDTATDSYAPYIRLATPSVDVPHSVLPIAVWTPVQLDGVELTGLDLSWVEVYRPLALRTRSFASPAVPGLPSSIPVGAMNLSPMAVTLQVSLEQPVGWKTFAEPQVLTYEKEDFKRVQVLLIPPADIPEGRYDFPLKIHLPEAEQTTITHGMLYLDMIHPVTPVNNHLADSKPSEAALAPHGTVAIFAKNGERVSVELKNPSADTIAWELFNPKMESVRHGDLKANDSAHFQFTALRDAAYLLTANAAEGDIGMTVSSSSHAIAVRASNAMEALVATDKTSGSFFVPTQATLFRMTLRRFPLHASATLVSPIGRRFAINKNATITIQPEKQEQNAVWTLETENAAGTLVSLDGDVVPWISASPETVMKN